MESRKVIPALIGFALISLGLLIGLCFVMDDREDLRRQFTQAANECVRLRQQLGKSPPFVPKVTARIVEGIKIGTGITPGAEMYLFNCEQSTDLWWQSFATFILHHPEFSVVDALGGENRYAAVRDKAFILKRQNLGYEIEVDETRPGGTGPGASIYASKFVILQVKPRQYH